METLKYANRNIKLLLYSKNMTQSTLSKKTGISETTLRRKLNSDVPRWTMTEGLDIAKALGYSVNDVFFTRMVPKCNTERND